MRIAFLLPLVLAGCTSPDTSSQAAAPSTPAAPAATPATTPAPPKASQDALVNEDGSIDKGLPKSAAPGAKMPKDGDSIVILNTTQGRIVVKFFPSKAPNHVKNFLDLSTKGFYDKTKFHRVIPGFMIQGGDPNTKGDDHAAYGTGGPGYNVKAEFNDMKHLPGILSMARTGDPDGAGSQFFIMHKAYPSLDNQYSIFGQVIEGMDVVEKIVNQDRDERDCPKKDMVISKVEVAKWPVKLNGI